MEFNRNSRNIYSFSFVLYAMKEQTFCVKKYPSDCVINPFEKIFVKHTFTLSITTTQLKQIKWHV
jgi:hypothetical protein